MGTNDPLLASALYLEQGNASCLFIGVDVILVSKALTATVRRRISQVTGINPSAILLSATHTHSGPVTVSYLSNEYDSTVPAPDMTYLQSLEDGIVRAGVAAWRARRPAEQARVFADATGIGTCRHDPHGPSDLTVPVLAVREADGGNFIALMPVCAMHPTVLHEDSKLFSGDFPGYARLYLQQQVVGADCPIIHHTGAAGNQSPRHVTRANTFAEAKRLGDLLGRAIAKALKEAVFSRQPGISFAQRFIDLPARQPASVAVAEERARTARARLNALRHPNSAPAEIRTAECDWFGAEESVAIAHAAEQGRLHGTLESILPAEIQVITVGDHTFVAWPGEFFVEFALRLRENYPDATVITLANGELQGYVVTQAAIDHMWYEAGNALLKSPEAGNLMVAATEELLALCKRQVDV